jgi:hypothetical protein
MEGHVEQAFIDALADGLGTEGFLERPPNTYRVPVEVIDVIGRIAQEPDSDPLNIPASGDLESIDLDIGTDYRLPPDDPQLSEAIEQSGVEAIAWYVSFHVSRAGWGIYVAEDSVEAFARRTFGSLHGLLDADKLRLGFQVVLDHELFHYWTDVACAQMEFATRQPIYVPYLRGHPNISSPVCQTEEALANARAWRRVKAPDAKMALGTEMRREPPGYRDWARYRSPKANNLGKRRLGADIHTTASPPPSPPVLPAAPVHWQDVDKALADLFAKSPSPPAAPVHWQAAPYEWFFDEHRVGAGQALVPVRPVRWERWGRRRPFLVPYARPISIRESRRFTAQLQRLPNEIQQMWKQKTKPSLESGHWDGLKFKKKTGSKDIWRCRVGGHYRAELTRVAGDVYEALRIGSRESL